MSKTAAMFFTFLLSACVHELVMVVVTHKFRCARFFMAYRGLILGYRFYLFVLQVGQDLWFFDYAANLVIDCANTNDCAKSYSCYKA